MVVAEMTFGMVRLDHLISSLADRFPISFNFYAIHEIELEKKNKINN